MADTKALSVSQISELIRMILETNVNLKNVTVRGEISNFSPNRSGHLYFSLKDEGAVIRSVMFRAQAARMPFELKDGMKVIAKGRVAVYPAGGSYQLILNELVPDGIGALQLAFEQRKQKLAAEGLFDEARKRPIPKVPLTVGVITSPTGAAIRDILNISKRRFPFAKVILFPAAVQGEGAVPDLRRGMAVMGQLRPSVIIIGRGGGSMEDLWAFNDEGLVRDIAACPIPVISAVGHEIDFTLCDFAADVRAPTPSAAAELAFPDGEELLRKFDNVSERLRLRILQRLERYNADLRRMQERPALRQPALLVQARTEALRRTGRELEEAMRDKLLSGSREIGRMASLLEAMSPLKTVARGYAVVRREDGSVVRGSDDVRVGDRIRMEMKDGEIGASVTDVSCCKDEKKEGNPNMDKPNELSFEEQYARLEAIVKRMEDAATPLNEMLALFEEGVGLVRSCSQILSEAEQKVVILTEGKDGTYDERSFESAE